MTNTTTPKIYVASLSDYNAGILHGAWIYCGEGLQTYEIQEDIEKQVLATSPTAECEGRPAEEWVIHDYEGFGSYKVEEYDDLEDVAGVANIITAEGNGELMIDFWQEIGCDIDEIESKFDEAFLGEYDDLESYAESYLEETGMLSSLPENLKYYFDFEKYAYDLSFEILTLDTENGVAVFSNC